MARKGLPGVVFVKDPVLQEETVVFRAEAFPEIPLVFFGYQHFLGAKILQPLVNILPAALGQKEFPGGNIEEGNPEAGGSKMDCSQEVVRLGLQQFVVVVAVAPDEEEVQQQQWHGHEQPLGVEEEVEEEELTEEEIAEAAAAEEGAEEGAPEGGEESE